MTDDEIEAAIEATRTELKAGEIIIGFGRTGIPGTGTLEAHHKDFPMPIGVVWFGFSANDRVDIYNSFVDERYRRCGVRTYLHEKLLQFYPNRIIASGAATKPGRAWMKATGYKQTPAGWEYKPRKKRRNAKR